MNRSEWPPARAPGRRVVLLLLAILLGVNAAVVWSVFSARRAASRLALEDLEWQTRAHARAVEAVLASLRGDLLFLARSSPLARAPETLAGEDPLARRWGRLDVEGSLLLFLQAHPPVERLEVGDGAGRLLLAAGRRAGAPVMLPAEAAAGPARTERGPGSRPDLLSAAWSLGAQGEEAGTLRAWIAPQRVVAQAAPGLADRLSVEAAVGGPSAAGSASEGPPGEGRVATGSGSGNDLLEARAAVADEGWSPPLAWTLVRREEAGRLVGSIESLTGRLGTTVAVNVAVLGLAFALATLAFREVRRAERLRALSEHQARLSELERQVLHNDRLASLGRLAAGFAHEINNPLAGMSNYLALLREDLDAGETAGAGELAARVREGLDRIAGITRQVLAFATPGRSAKGPVDLGDLLRRNLDFLRADPSFREIELEVALPREPVTVDGNPTTLDQLILNLLLNAAQAQPEGGAIEVALSRNGTRALLAVTDRGPGLDREALEHAFEPFFSTRGSAGLGLAVCRGIAEDHAGAIRAVNRSGGGARFEVELPLSAGDRR